MLFSNNSYKWVIGLGLSIFFSLQLSCGVKTPPIVPPPSVPYQEPVVKEDPSPTPSPTPTPTASPKKKKAKKKKKK